MRWRPPWQACDRIVTRNLSPPYRVQHPEAAAYRGVHNKGEALVDKDRIEGIGKQIKGAVKDMAGKVTGDSALQAEGKADKAEGKVQNTVGGAKDKVRDATNG
jgi:uncharacterized protein YjbJ (UPF0337 family)